MPLKPGNPAFGSEISETRPAATGVSAGDVVMIDTNGEMAPADTEAGDHAGVARYSADDDDRGNALALQGAFIAAAEGTVTEGDRVDAGNATDGTTGQYITDAAGPALALSDTGGTWHGADGADQYDVPAGYIVAKL